MKKIIWLLLILVIHSTVVVKRLSDKETSKLTINDTILSTLGMHRLTLRSNNCSLRIDRFDYSANSYKFYYNCVSTHYLGGSCEYLTIRNGTLFTDKGNVYSTLLNATYLQSALTLDDMGNVRLQGIAEAGNNQGKPNLIANTKILKGNGTELDYIEVHSEFDQAIDGLLYQKINEKNWFFTFDNQTLTINNFDGTVSKTVPFKENIFN